MSVPVPEVPAFHIPCASGWTPDGKTFHLFCGCGWNTTTDWHYGPWEAVQQAGWRFEEHMKQRSRVV